MKRKQWFIIGGILVALAVAGVLGVRRQTGLPVQVAVAGREDVQAKVSANGKIQAMKKVDITANSIGQVTRMMVQEGDVVRAGDLLLEIDPARSRAAAQSLEATLRATSHDLETANARLLQARKDFARADANHKAGIISQSDFDQARTALRRGREHRHGRPAAGGPGPGRSARRRRHPGQDPDHLAHGRGGDRQAHRTGRDGGDRLAEPAGHRAADRVRHEPGGGGDGSGRSLHSRR